MIGTAIKYEATKYYSTNVVKESVGGGERHLEHSLKHLKSVRGNFLVGSGVKIRFNLR